MLFARRDGDATAGDAASLKDIIGQAPDNVQQFAGQLSPGNENEIEAFVVNVLEHVLASNPNIISDDPAGVSRSLEAWQKALEPLRDALRRGKIKTDKNEDDSLNAFFKTEDIRYMRNWPTKYWQLLRDDPDGRASGFVVRPLTVGILGGQSLAIVASSPHFEPARQFIRFMAGESAQRILASHGFAPTRRDVYDERMKVFIPHINRIRTAIESSQPRPRHRNYRAFSEAISDRIGPILNADVPSAPTNPPKDLGQEFINAINDALSR